MSELTTSRIQRQFRSLRSKCSALDTFTLAPIKPAVFVTYSRHAQRKPMLPESDDTPPLAILQSLDKFSTRLHFDRAIVETMQLSKHIYEVRDAFKHIVLSTVGTYGSESRDSPRVRVLPLTALCARVVGEHAQSEIAASVHPDSGLDHFAEEDIRTQALAELYEQVPSPYRHYTMIAHALTYILETCPHHPTLLHSLLEICIWYNLAPEAQKVLFELFNTSIRPRPYPTSPCPLTHPAHKNFLTMLRDTCGVSQPPAIPVINDRTFVSILVDALSLTCPEQLSAWTSKAITRIAREYRKEDFSGCFVPMCVALAGALARPIDTTRRSISRTKSVEDIEFKLREEALERLAKWVDSMLDTLRSAILTDVNAADTYSACVDFLVEVLPLRFHSGEAQPASSATCLSDALCCLATYCIASPFSPPVPTTDPDHLIIERLLGLAHTTNDTFDALVSYTYPHPNVSVYREDAWQVEDDTPTPTLSPVVDDSGLDGIEHIAASLRTRSLLHCEVALYHQTLRHIEDLVSAPTHAIPPGHQFSRKVMFELRMQLIDRIEDAERRCYGGAPAAIPGAAQQPDGQWQWEELVGSWVLKSPAPIHAQKAKQKTKTTNHSHKRRKVSDTGSRPSRSMIHPRISERRSEYRVPSNESLDEHFPSSRDVSGSRKRKAPSSSTSRMVSTRPAPRHTGSSHTLEISSDSEDEIALPMRAPRRSGNFTTILADAQMNAISLRAEREAKAAKAKAKAKARGRVSAPARMFTAPHPSTSASGSARRAPPQQPVQRQSSFATILADSLRNMVSLREERAHERERAERARNASTKPVKRPTAHQKRTCVDLSSDSEDSGRTDADLSRLVDPVHDVVEPSSDDALNLFAYPDSSPVRQRSR